VAGDGVREGQEISRRIRDELERIREAESRVEEALETVRQARRRVEVAARELSREEERVRAWVREEINASGAGSARNPARGGEGATEPESASGESGARAWRSDAPQGWSTWREAPAPVPESVPGVAAARSVSPPTQPPAIQPPGPAAPPLVSSASLQERRPAPDALVPPAFGATPIPSTTTPARPPTDRSVWWTRVGLGVLAALAVALIGWFAIRGLRSESESVPVVADAPSPAASAPAPTQPAPVAEQPAAPASPLAASPLAVLPTDPSARQALYDSLFAARTPLFDPLLARVDSANEDRAVRRALTAWKEGPIDAQDADLIHSALLQHVLKAEIDPRIEIDGQVLRNPCRGASCVALLKAWEQGRETYGLPPVPANATTDPRALRQAEAALVLNWLRSANAAGTPAP
jgi:hypothetical protein